MVLDNLYQLTAEAEASRVLVHGHSPQLHI
jgi:hypothetical protein